MHFLGSLFNLEQNKTEKNSYQVLRFPCKYGIAYRTSFVADFPRKRPRSDYLTVVFIVWLLLLWFDLSSK